MSPPADQDGEVEQIEDINELNMTVHDIEFGRRNVGILGTCFNIFKCFIGIGLLALPSAFSQVSNFKGVTQNIDWNHWRFSYHHIDRYSQLLHNDALDQLQAEVWRGCRDILWFGLNGIWSEGQIRGWLLSLHILGWMLHCLLTLRWKAIRPSCLLWVEQWRLLWKQERLHNVGGPHLDACLLHEDLQVHILPIWFR